MKKLVLFDLDGTLVRTGGAGLRALELAFMGLYGLSRAMEGVQAAGKTDPSIVREVFEKKLGRSPAMEEVGRLRHQYLWFLAREIEDGQGYRVIDGVRTLLEALAQRSDVVLALGTGNWEKGARIKLEPGGLNGYFPFGGFGSDAEGRADVLRAAVRRAEERAGGIRMEVIVIGDTVLDVAAGRAIGAVTVAVATGHGRPGELLSCGPDVFMEDFLDPARLLARLN